ncbi:MAG: hypothetical protein L6R42_000416 [Xanthoria sp. 1 TBL-2021]|nr:MAG: hypothetical protein L6R42_000416 [Xanthoria sp. 1 TBL-2021]
MQNRPFSPINQPRTGGILPPLSKYYYGPAVSPDRTPVNAPDTGWNAQSPHRDPPALPPRQLRSTASASSISQQPSHHDASLQQNKLPGPPPTAPPAHPVARSSYNPNNYAPMPGARHSPINATWNQSSTSVVQGDTSTWGVNYHHNVSQHGLKPPLPNGSIEYLRPIAYSPVPSPSIPQGFSPAVQYQSQQVSWQSEPRRLPPPPPPKIHGHGENLQDQPSRTRPGGPQESDVPPQTNGPPSSFGVGPLDSGVDRPRPYSDGSSKATPQDHAGDAVVSPQSTGDHLDDNYYASRSPRRKNTTESDWSVQSDTGTPPSGPTASDARTADIPPLKSQNPSLSPMYNVHDRSTLPAHQQDSRLANGTSAEKGGKDLHHDEEGHYNGDMLTNNRRRDSQIKSEASPSLGEEAIAPSAPGEGNLFGGNYDQSQRDDSFYWHSPQTSASTSHDRDQNRDVPGTSSLLDATPEPQEQYVLAPPQEANSISTSERVTSPIKSPFGSYSASALGFGGPSDWEHFGDYDGEEVDDTALYLRPRSPVKQALPVDTPELPADPAAPVNLQGQEPPKVLEEYSRLAPAIQPEGPRSMPYDEPQPEKATHEDFKGISLEDDITNPEDVGIFEQLGPVKPHRSHHSPPAEQPPDTVRDSAPKLPKLDFEHVQRKSEPRQDLVKDLDLANLEQNGNPSFEPQASTSLAAREKQSHVSVQSGLPEEPATIDNDAPVGMEPPPSDDQTHTHIGLPLVKDVATTQADYQDQSRQDYTEPLSDAQDSSRDDSIKRASLVSDGSVLSKAKELSGPYADLDPWAKASLNRYVTMLHEEARASTDLEKLNMFKAFSRKEWKLRAVLYGADDELGDDLLAARNDRPIQRANTLDFQRPASKALPALPPEADRPRSQVDQEDPLVSPKLLAPTMARLITRVEEETPVGSSEEESVTVVEPVGGRRQQNAEVETTESYSPGGRPIRAQASDLRKSITQSLPDTSNRHDTCHSIASNDSKPAYTPFRYSQGYVDDTDQPVDRRASFRPYAALKLGPVEDHARTTPEPTPENPHPTSLTPNANPNASDGLPRETISSNEQVTSSTQRSSETRSPWSLPTDQEQPLDLRRFEKADFDPLTAVLPLSGHIPQGVMELVNFQRGMNTVPDDFGFIHQHVVAWDTKAKKIRGEHEKDRQSRQTESEQRIDALFNDDEIGYGDISELEEEFKRAEAARKTSEDRAEYSTFVEEVFNVVWTRLHFEIDQLTPMYDEYTSLAHETLAGKEMFEATEGQYALAPSMSTLLTIHQKLEIRHQKAFEAVLERDRILKKTEVAPWYTLGKVTKVKQLEKQFDRAEKKAIVEYCKQRDARANRLMDVLDQNTLRGVGANQDYMEAVMKAVRRIASGRAFASAPASEPGLGMEEVIKAKTVTAVLASSSEQIVQTFHVADMLLNAADYELSVATARLANADSTTLERLKDERTAEDAKLMRDLQHRLALIREDSRRTNDEIVKLLCFLGVQGGHAQAGKMPTMPLHADAEHEQRLQKALEDAKRRNGQKAAAATDGTS